MKTICHTHYQASKEASTHTICYTPPSPPNARPCMFVMISLNSHQQLTKFMFNIKIGKPQTTSNFHLSNPPPTWTPTSQKVSYFISFDKKGYATFWKSTMGSEPNISYNKYKHHAFITSLLKTNTTIHEHYKQKLYHKHPTNKQISMEMLSPHPSYLVTHKNHLW